MEKGEELVEAKKIVKNPEIVDNYEGKYLLVWDSSLVGGEYKNFEKAINILADKGWKLIQIEAMSKINALYAVLEKP